MWMRWKCCGAEKLRFLINIPLLSPQQLWSVICNLPLLLLLTGHDIPLCDVTSVTVTLRCAKITIIQTVRLTSGLAWHVLHITVCCITPCVTVCYSVLHGECHGGTDTHSWLRLRRSEAGPSITREEGWAAPSLLLIYRHCPGVKTFPRNTLVFSYNLMHLIIQNLIGYRSFDNYDGFFKASISTTPRVDRTFSIWIEAPPLLFNISNKSHKAIHWFILLGTSIF